MPTESPYRLLVLDIDGTLLSRSSTISDRDKTALRRLSASGVRVALSSGRAAQACRSIIEQLTLDGYHIFFDGALVSDPRTGKEVYVRPLDPGLVADMVRFSHQHAVNFELFSATRFFIERETWATPIRREFFGLQPTVVDFDSIKHSERIIKGTMMLLSPEERVRADVLLKHFRDSLHFSWTKAPAYPEIDFINMLAPDVSKGKALEALASFLGITLDSIVAIGDGANDISLFTRVGLAVAMGNAPDSVKAAAHWVTGDAEHSGVAAAIERIFYRRGDC